MHKLLYLLLMILLPLPLSAQQKSGKRGVCWDEKTLSFTEASMQRLAPGVSWMYNWGVTPRNPSVVGPGREVEFAPMCWNGNFNETALRNYLSAHPGVKYLLTYNEPNISGNSGGSSMTPTQAANAWPRLEKIADDFNLKIVAPALNFSGDNIGGRVYSTPYDWLEAFIALRPDARFDYLCLHCYMDYASAVKWFATEYFYKDIYSAENQRKYPHLVNYLRNHEELPLFLTEFCAMGNDFRSNGLAPSVDLQIDHMTQKLQYLEQSDKVAAYAWFMANGNAGYSPYWSLLQTNRSTSDLSEVGKVYVYMSAFDKEKYYKPGETIMAKDYIDASTDNQQVKLRPNSEVASAAEVPLQVEFQSSSWASYQLDIPSGGEYSITMNCKSTADNNIWLYVDGKKVKTTSVEATAHAWTERELKITLAAGQHKLMVFNASQSPIFINRLTLHVTNGIGSVSIADCEPIGEPTYYSLNGAEVSTPTHGVFIAKTTYNNGEVRTKKIIK
ncbi:MAG: glycosyl hydrolase [Prevotella sp.]|jgi:hypothetical protein